MTDTVTTTVEVASPAGHETFQLTRDQTVNLVEEQGGNTWVFASGQLVQPAQLADTAVSYTHLTLPTNREV